MPRIRCQTFLFAIVMLLSSMVLSACNGVGDWRVDLPGGYAVWRINSESVILCLPDEERPFLARTVVDRYVFEIAVNGEYIFAKRADFPEGGHWEMYLSEPDYYIVDIREKSCLGPLDDAAFDEAIHTLELDVLPEWINVHLLQFLSQEQVCDLK